MKYFSTLDTKFNLSKGIVQTSQKGKGLKQKDLWTWYMILYWIPCSSGVKQRTKKIERFKTKTMWKLYMANIKNIGAEESYEKQKLSINRLWLPSKQTPFFCKYLKTLTGASIKRMCLKCFYNFATLVSLESSGLISLKIHF